VPEPRPSTGTTPNPTRRGTTSPGQVHQGGNGLQGEVQGPTGRDINSRAQEVSEPLDLEALKDFADRVQGEYSRAVERLREERVALIEAEDMVTYATEAQKLVQHVARQVQEDAHRKISHVVSRCIAAVYLNPYEFQILFEAKRGKTEARLIFTRDGKEFKPTGETGGGVVDVAAFGLRIACIMVERPRLRKLLVADEPFRNVHGEENRRRCAQMVMTLSQDLGVQIILTTGLEWLRIGKVIRL
jgi:hypothetical protein